MNSFFFYDRSGLENPEELVLAYLFLASSRVRGSELCPICFWEAVFHWLIGWTFDLSDQWEQLRAGGFGTTHGSWSSLACVNNCEQGTHTNIYSQHFFILCGGLNFFCLLIPIVWFVCFSNYYKMKSQSHFFIRLSFVFHSLWRPKFLLFTEIVRCLMIVWWPNFVRFTWRSGLSKLVFFKFVGAGCMPKRVISRKMR